MTGTSTMHLRDDRPTGLCGDWPRCGAGTEPGGLPTTDDRALVTCRRCRAMPPTDHSRTERIRAALLRIGVDV